MKKYIIGVAIVGLVGVGFYKKIYIPKHTFKVVNTKKGEMPIVVDGVGNIDAENIYKVSALYGGTIKDFNLKIGDTVKKGEIIAHIDYVDLQDKIDEIKANLQVLSHTIKSSAYDALSAYKQYKYQAEVLKKNEKLFKRGAISELDYKKFQTDAQTADAKVKSIKEKIESLKSQEIQLKSTLNGLKERLKRYTIVAPIDGYVTKKYISNNNIIGNSQPIIEIVNPKDIWISTPIDTRISSNVKLGNKALIKLRSSEDFQSGYVVKMNPLNNPVTNEREIFVKFNKLPIPFYMNEQAIVKIKVKKLKDVTIIPAKALSYNDGYGVWLLDGNKVHFKKVEILVNNSKKVAIKDDIKKQIIIPNPKKAPLKDGMKIYHD